MRFIMPRMYVIAETVTRPDELSAMLDDIGTTWRPPGHVDAQDLIETAGRLCYKSFEAGLNPNVTKVRTEQDKYINNILQQRHGSVIEHATVTLAFIGVSRVFTHEIVRHRPCSFSQESLRYVRLTDLAAYFPRAFAEHEKSQQLRSMFQQAFEYLENLQKDLAVVLDLDGSGDFAVKKSLTSSMRRLAPIGLATNIIVTANHRQWRHIFDQRSSAGAEEEIRMIFRELGYQFINRYPALYQDATITNEGIQFANVKI